MSRHTIETKDTSDWPHKTRLAILLCAVLIPSALIFVDGWYYLAYVTSAGKSWLAVLNPINMLRYTFTIASLAIKTLMLTPVALLLVALYFNWPRDRDVSDTRGSA